MISQEMGCGHEHLCFDLRWDEKFTVLGFPEKKMKILSFFLLKKKHAVQSIKYNHPETEVSFS